MMTYTAIALLYLPVVGFIILILQHLRSRLYTRRTARQLGCSPAPRCTPDRLFGIRTLLSSIRATREEWGPIFMHQAINNVSLPSGAPAHTVRAPIFDYELLITRDPENAKAMFATQSEDFDIGHHREKTFKSLLGLGVMTSRGEKWRHSRALVRGQFARWNIKNLDLLKVHTDALIRRVGDGSSAVAAGEWTGTVDLGPLFQALTLDVGTEFLFGTSTCTLDPEDRLPAASNANLDAFGGHLDAAKHMLDRRGALAKYGWLIRDGSYPEHCAEIRRVVDHFVSLKLSGTAEAEKGESDRFVLLDEMIKETRNPVELRSELLNVLHASRDTTAALMGWLFYFLARHPTVWQNLRAEILQQFGTGLVTDEKVITFDGLGSLPYLRWVINETIRMVGIVPMNERMALRNTTLPRGGGHDGQSPVFVAKGQQVLIPTYSMQHREDIWGEDVEQFLPERWEKRAHGWEFIPFGGGTRQCLGQQFAKLEASYVLVRFVQQFDVLENMETGDGKLRMHHTIENRSGSGVQVRFRAA